MGQAPEEGGQRLPCSFAFFIGAPPVFLQRPTRYAGLGGHRASRIGSDFATALAGSRSCSAVKTERVSMNVASAAGERAHVPDRLVVRLEGALEGVAANPRPVPGSEEAPSFEEGHVVDLVHRFRLVLLVDAGQDEERRSSQGDGGNEPSEARPQAVDGVFAQFQPLLGRDPLEPGNEPGDLDDGELGSIG